MKIPKPTEAELEILQILWQHGPSTVRQVNEIQNKSRGENEQIGYTTTLKLMQLMHGKDKNLLDRDARQRTHIYQARVSEEVTQKGLLDRLMQTAFGGSAMKLVMQALGNKKTSREELAEIRKLLDKMEKGGES